MRLRGPYSIGVATCDRSTKIELLILLRSKRASERVATSAMDTFSLETAPQADRHLVYTGQARHQIWLLLFGFQIGDPRAANAWLGVLGISIASARAPAVAIERVQEPLSVKLTPIMKCEPSLMVEPVSGARPSKLL